MKQVSTLLSMLKPLMDRDTSWDLMMAKNHLIFDNNSHFSTTKLELKTNH